MEFVFYLLSSENDNKLLLSNNFFSGNSWKSTSSLLILAIWSNWQFVSKVLKVAFFQKVRFIQPPKKTILQKTILNFKFKISAQNSIMLWAGFSNFELKIALWNIFFSRFGDLKNEPHFLKKSHLYFHSLFQVQILSPLRQEGLKYSSWKCF